MPALPVFTPPNGTAIGWLQISVANGDKPQTPTRPARTNGQISVQFELEATVDGVTHPTVRLPQISVADVAARVASMPASQHKAKCVELLAAIGRGLFFIAGCIGNEEGQCELPQIPT